MTEVDYGTFGLLTPTHNESLFRHLSRREDLLIELECDQLGVLKTTYSGRSYEY